MSQPARGAATCVAITEMDATFASGVCQHSRHALIHLDAKRSL